MINPDFIKLQQLLKMLKDLKDLTTIQKSAQDIQRVQQIVKLIHQLRDIQKARECLEIFQTNPELFGELSGEDKELLREAADYDEVEWAKIVRDLEKK